MNFHAHRPRPTNFRSAECSRYERFGYTLSEILIVVVIMGILAGISISFTNLEIQRARINSVQLSLAGWLQSIQRAALEKKSDAIASAGCTVSFNQVTNQTNGSVIATVAPTSCSTSPSLEIDVPSLGNSLVSTSRSLNSIVFTPRGTTIYPAITSGNPSFEYQIRLSGSSRLRCVRISGLVGVIEIGSRTTSSSISDQCTDFSRI